MDMEPLKINKTDLTPKVILDKKANKFLIEGNSYPENVKAFYSSIVSWIDEYIEDPNDKTRIEFKLNYYNSSSSKVIYEMLKRLTKILKNGKEIEIIWYYRPDDDDIKEAGKDLAAIISIPVILKEFS